MRNTDNLLLWFVSNLQRPSPSESRERLTSQGLTAGKEDHRSWWKHVLSICYDQSSEGKHWMPYEGSTC